MEHAYRLDSYEHKRTHSTVDSSQGRYVHFSGDPADTWYDTFRPLGVIPRQVRLGPSPFTRHLFERGLADIVEFREEGPENAIKRTA